MKLSEKTNNCRIDRPDEWTMDNFMRDAIMLEKRIVELEANKAKSNELINWFLDAVFKGSDICGDGAQDKMFELGILTREIYNPEIHTLRDGSECDEGDYIYFKSEEV